MPKNNLFLWIVVLVFCSAEYVRGKIDIQSFPFTGTIEPMISNTGPVRFTLDPHWLQQAGDGQKKLRLVDSQFNEIPFAVVLASDSIEVPEWVSLQVSSFDYGEGEQTMILENNHPETPVASIRFQTHSRDFHRAAEVWTSNDKENWHWQTSGYIVDASSQINFRQLEIALQPVRARWIRIRLTDTGSNRRAHASLTIQTLQEVIVQLPTEAALSIRQIQAKLLLEKPVSKSFGSLRLFPAASTEDSNTILPLNDLRLPVDRISFEVDQSVFSRHFILQEMTTHGTRILWQDQLVRTLDGSNANLTFAMGIPYMTNGKVVIKNEGNPPLTISGIQIEWFQREFVFIAEPGNRYTLLAGNFAVPSVNYDLAHILKLNHERINSMPRVQPPLMIANPEYLEDKHTYLQWLRHNTVMILVIIIAFGLLLWMRIILRSTPDQSSS